MPMKFFLFLFLMVCITSCEPPYIADNSYMPSKGALVNEVTNKTLVQLKKEKELYPFGVGSGMMHQIRMLAIGFRYYKEVDINQARELVIAAGTLYLNTINAKEQIRPFLKTYPFQPENIEIEVYLQKPNGLEPDPEKLTIASMIRGILNYDIMNPETGRLTTIYRETFQEAAAKLGITEENGQYRQVAHVASN
jgi:hypothetical protein